MLSISLTISTLHSHHNLELHNSPDFADTGQCLNDYSPLCPICGCFLQDSELEANKAVTNFDPTAVLTVQKQTVFSNQNYIPILGRSPPFLYS